MAESPILYYITDRTALASDEPTRRRNLLEKISEAAHAGVNYIQLREKDLSARELEALAREAVHAIRETRSTLLINSRTDVAIATGAGGVHLRSNDIPVHEAKKIWQAGKCGAGSPARELSPGPPLIAVSAHTLREVTQAANQGATFTVFGPVFEKKASPEAQSTGLDMLREACQANIPVLALGGVTVANARSCLEAGAAGIAAIRLFQENKIEEVVHALRGA